MILNRKNNYKLIAIFIFCSFSYSQSLSSDNYKTSLRMKLAIDKNPALYLDEPLSADLEKIHKACKVYIYLYERKSDSEMIQLSGNEIKLSVEKMNMFQRLRDFNVPAVVLDEIFSNKKDLKTMEKSWEELKSKGMKDDEIAEAISKIIIDELGDEFIQSLPTEK